MNKTRVFIHAYSYEERSIESIKHISYSESGYDLVITLDYIEVPKQLVSAYKNNKRIIDEKVKLSNIKQEIIDVKYNSQLNFINIIKSKLPEKVDIDLDITNLTKLHIMRLLFEYGHLIKNVTYISANAHYLNEDSADELLKTGNRSTIISGFEGILVPELPTILVIISGFETTRAQSAYNSISPDICIQIAGVPWLEPDKAIDYISKSMDINKHLSYHQNCFTELAPSLCPRGFASRLRDIITKYKDIYKSKGEENCNVIIVPLGTKIQTLGTYFYFTKHPETRIYYTNKTNYTECSIGVGELSMYSLKDRNLDEIETQNKREDLLSEYYAQLSID
ncbi:hypothetical protein [Thalassomonas actiniarum]|uniref:Uncharacterized protein n=1 Tax=Thalassomonas actiniarum TaxID=485447 RepID=A0AAE9YMH3_9GAMM|nr:hypothetical protein [Thalassomonas actiniarum]WDD97243.1 hypothetical protein SG35_018095 [Thalassomonas actiniarum]